MVTCKSSQRTSGLHLRLTAGRPHLTGRQAASRPWIKHAKQVVFGIRRASSHTRATRQSPGENGRARWRANHGTAVELREFHAFRSHLVQVRRVDGGVSKGAYVAVTQIVGEENDKVGRGDGILWCTFGYLLETDRD